MFFCKCRFANALLQLSFCKCFSANVLRQMFFCKCSSANVLLQIFFCKCRSANALLQLSFCKCFSANALLQKFWNFLCSSVSEISWLPSHELPDFSREPCCRQLWGWTPHCHSCLLWLTQRTPDWVRIWWSILCQQHEPKQEFFRWSM